MQNLENQLLTRNVKACAPYPLYVSLVMLAAGSESGSHTRNVLLEILGIQDLKSTCEQVFRLAKNLSTTFHMHNLLCGALLDNPDFLKLAQNYLGFKVIIAPPTQERHASQKNSIIFERFFLLQQPT